MKLQAKFTLNFIAVVLITIAVSFFLINRNVQNEFMNFIRIKNQQWADQHRPTAANHPPAPANNSSGPLENPFEMMPPGTANQNTQTPEQHFVQSMNSSFVWAAGIDLLCAIILAYLLSKFLLRRIYRLKSSMNQYLKDGTNKPVAHDGNDEVDELANIYNTLIEKIQREEKIRKDFFVDMSHELRTPLTSIKGYLEGLVDKVFDPTKEKEIHQKTLSETDRMIHLVKELTALAKLETEKVTLNLQEVNLRAMTEEIVEMLKAQLAERDLKVSIEGSLTTKVDEHKFKQVLINLLDNAAHYAKKSTTITVEMDKKSLRIKNSVDGTPPKNVENFFERFYRGDKSRSYEAKKPHLGIGLNIVKKIVEQHGGKITARVEGDEIIFEILLP